MWLAACAPAFAIVAFLRLFQEAGAAPDQRASATVRVTPPALF